MTDRQKMETQFNLIASEYDSGRRKFIPCFDDYYEKTTKFVSSLMPVPRRVIDLGAGTGLLAMYFYRHFPQAEYVLTDVAEEMLKVARQRFSGAENIHFQISDYTRQLPDGDFDLVISALSIHHLENEQKAGLFSRICRRLAPGNWFINYDQFCASTPEMSEAIDRFWIDHLYKSGLTAEELSRWQERRKLDRECSVEEELCLLKQSGFSTEECIFLNGKFAVVAARV